MVPKRKEDSRPKVYSKSEEWVVNKYSNVPAT